MLREVKEETAFVLDIIISPPKSPWNTKVTILITPTRFITLCCLFCSANWVAFFIVVPDYSYALKLCLLVLPDVSVQPCKPVLWYPEADIFIIAWFCVHLLYSITEETSFRCPSKISINSCIHHTDISEFTCQHLWAADVVFCGRHRPFCILRSL